MKKNFFLGLIALTALTVTSCTNDEVVEAVPQKKAIEFGTYLGRDAQARGAELTTDGLQEKGFGVFASYTESNDWAETYTPNFMFNQKVEYSSTSTAWEYSPIKYWPEKKNEKISFFAYGPYWNYADTPAATVTPKGGEDDAAANTVAGAPTVTFTQSTDVTKMVDFVAGVAMNQSFASTSITETDDSQTVNFTLKHELTRVNFEAKLDEEAYSAEEGNTKNKTKINITAVKIDAGGKFFSSADYTFATTNDVTGDSPVDYRGTWSSHTESAADLDLAGILNSAAASDLGGYTTSGILLANTTAVPLFKQAVAADETNSVEAQAADYLFLIPPVQSDGTTGLAATDVINVTFTYDIVTVDAALSAGHSKTTATKTVALPVSIATTGEGTTSTPTLQQGKAYKFTFIFGLHEVKVSATVSAWDTNEIAGGDTTIDWSTDEPTEDDANS